MNDQRRAIPSVDALIASDEFVALLATRPRSLVLAVLRDVLDRLRLELIDGQREAVPGTAEIARLTGERLLALERPSLRRVINATGIPLHTNLGRAPLPAPARAALDGITRGYSNLEYDLTAGARGSRHDHCAALLTELTGAGGALVVNNNAAAVVLVLNELAEGRQVIVSRGELVEIGESFRVPEIIAKSGARIVEVGATNRTHARDYEASIGPETGAILKVHRSNFSQRGFVSEVEIDELANLAHRHEIPLVHDLGSGLLPEPPGDLGLPAEPSARASLNAGADLVTFSGDKLLGGPQAGVVVGRRDLIEHLRRNPLLRALRVGKLTLAALEATLQLWRDPATARGRIPAVAMIAADRQALHQRAERLAAKVRDVAPDACVDVVQDVTQVGGGACPGVELDTWVLRIEVPGRAAAELEATVRGGDPAIVGRLRGDRLVLDPRTVLADEERDFVDALSRALKKRLHR